MGKTTEKDGVVKEFSYIIDTYKQQYKLKLEE